MSRRYDPLSRTSSSLNDSTEYTPSARRPYYSDAGQRLEPFNQASEAEPNEANGRVNYTRTQPSASPQSLPWVSMGQQDHQGGSDRISYPAASNTALPGYVQSKPGGTRCTGMCCKITPRYQCSHRWGSSSLHGAAANQNRTSHHGTSFPWVTTVLGGDETVNVLAWLGGRPHDVIFPYSQATSTGGEPMDLSGDATSFLYYCPMVTCKMRSTAYSGYVELLRHLVRNHLFEEPDLVEWYRRLIMMAVSGKPGDPRFHRC